MSDGLLEKRVAPAGCNSESKISCESGSHPASVPHLSHGPQFGEPERFRQGERGSESLTP